MAIKKPILAIFNFSRILICTNVLVNLIRKNKIMAEKKVLYQTKSPSLREMSLPKIPVKPENITAMCNFRYEFFMKRDARNRTRFN